MVIVQGKAKTKSSGKKIIKFYRSKRKYEIGRVPTETKLAERKVKAVRTKGGGAKQKLMSDQVINIYDPKSKKHSKVKVKTAVENTANRNFVRRNILTKGAIVDTEAGKAKITSRPGQDGILNGVLV